MGIKVEENFGDFLKDLIVSIRGLESIDGNTLIEDGQLTDTSVPIDETKLSQSKEEAIEEYQYVEARKTGEDISSEDEEKIKRIERDILKDKSKGFIYGSRRDSR